MSSVFSVLTPIDERTLHLHQVHKQLRRQGADSSMQSLPGTPCLRFDLSGPRGRMVCRVQAHDWARQHLPDLPGLDWQRMSHDHLAGLCAVERALHLQTPALEYRHAHFQGLVVAGLDAPLHPQLHSLEGPVWVEELDWHWPQAATPIEVTGRERVPVRMRLGAVRHTVQRLQRLQPGDIVLLPFARPQAWRAHRCLFEFSLQPDSLTVTMIYPTEADQPSLDTVMESDIRHDTLDLASLPLTLDVVLTTLQLSLAELADLGAGSTLHLPEQAYRRIRIEHNGHCLATGELVQVGATLGVQLAQAPRLK